MSQQYQQKWMMCPDCKCRICLIDNIYFSCNNNVPMIKLRCECNNKQFLNIALNDYIQDINKANVNKCNCYIHPYNNNCNVFCKTCKCWICKICEDTHNINHRVCCYNDLFMKSKCVIHSGDVYKYYCETCNVYLCEVCLNEQHNKSEHCVVMLNQLWDEMYKGLVFKNIEEINKFFDCEKEKIDKYKNDKIKMLNNMIGVLEKTKMDIEKEYINVIEKNKNFISIVKIAYDNFYNGKHFNNYNTIHNVKIFSLNNIFKDTFHSYNNSPQSDNNYETQLSDTCEQILKNTKSFLSTRIFLNTFIQPNKHIDINNTCNTQTTLSHASNYVNKVYNISYSKTKTFFSKCTSTLKSHTNAIYDIIELPNGNIASCSSDNTIKIWSLSSEQCLITLTGHQGTVWNMCLLRDSRLASCSDDKTIKIWNIYTQQCELTLHAHDEPIHTIYQMENGCLLSGSYDTSIKVWNLNNSECIMCLNGHNESVYRVIELNKGIIVSSSYDKSIKVWNVDVVNCINRCVATLLGHKSYVWSVIKVKWFNNEHHNIIASGSTDSTIKVWDVDLCKCLFTLKGHTFTVVALIQGENGNLISGSYDNKIKIWDLMYQQCIATFMEHTNAVWALRQLSSGKLLSGSWDKTIKVWN